jgi:hypothetical protein
MQRVQSVRRKNSRGTYIPGTIQQHGEEREHFAISADPFQQIPPHKRKFK